MAEKEPEAALVEAVREAADYICSLVPPMLYGYAFQRGYTVDAYGDDVYLSRTWNAGDRHVFNLPDLFPANMRRANRDQMLAFASAVDRGLILEIREQARAEFEAREENARAENAHRRALEDEEYFAADQLKAGLAAAKEAVRELSRG